jgi:predicted small secreted protein
MKRAAFLILLATCTFLFGCSTTMQVGSPFQAGRRALFAGDDEAALGFFQTVAERDPNFVSRPGALRGKVSGAMSAARSILRIDFHKPGKAWNGRFPAIAKRISPGFILD